MVLRAFVGKRRRSPRDPRPRCAAREVPDISLLCSGSTRSAATLVYGVVALFEGELLRHACHEYALEVVASIVVLNFDPCEETSSLAARVRRLRVRSRWLTRCETRWRRSRICMGEAGPDEAVSGISRSSFLVPTIRRGYAIYTYRGVRRSDNATSIGHCHYRSRVDEVQNRRYIKVCCRTEGQAHWAVDKTCDIEKNKGEKVGRATRRGWWV